MNPNEQVDFKCDPFGNYLSQIGGSSEDVLHEDIFLAGYASGKKAGRQEAIDEMAGKSGEGFLDWQNDFLPKHPFGNGNTLWQQDAWRDGRKPLLARIKQLEMKGQYNSEWFAEAEKRIKALEDELIRMHHCCFKSDAIFSESSFPIAKELAKQEKP